MAIEFAHVAIVTDRESVVSLATLSRFKRELRSLSAKVDLQFDNHCSFPVPTHLSLPQIIPGMVPTVPSQVP